ncbi:hypothetical protein V6U90_24350 [Micromonospora sp. CPCC 206060]|uniref:hypothetical protein n=1 Tax=Micromonospora sp. CPCC 206060 TaxID=3122406 RepID=UPI002FF0B0BD
MRGDAGQVSLRDGGVPAALLVVLPGVVGHVHPYPKTMPDSPVSVAERDWGYVRLFRYGRDMYSGTAMMKPWSLR